MAIHDLHRRLRHLPGHQPAGQLRRARFRPGHAPGARRRLAASQLSGRRHPPADLRRARRGPGQYLAGRVPARGWLPGHGAGVRSRRRAVARRQGRWPSRSDSATSAGPRPAPTRRAATCGTPSPVPAASTSSSWMPTSRPAATSSPRRFPTSMIRRSRSCRRRSSSGRAPAQNWVENAAGAIQEVFYRSIQVARDRFGAAICVGTSAVYRRAALEAEGGPTLIPYAEDVHTGLDVRRAGWSWPTCRSCCRPGSARTTWIRSCASSTAGAQVTRGSSSPAGCGPCR